jgi:hypothetical protein
VLSVSFVFVFFILSDFLVLFLFCVYLLFVNRALAKRDTQLSLVLFILIFSNYSHFFNAFAAFRCSVRFTASKFCMHLFCSHFEFPNKVARVPCLRGRCDS